MRAGTPTATAGGDVTLAPRARRERRARGRRRGRRPGFDETAVDEWNADELGEDGMGLAIIRAVAEDVEIGPRGDGGGTRHPLHPLVALSAASRPA